MGIALKSFACGQDAERRLRCVFSMRRFEKKGDANGIPFLWRLRFRLLDLCAAAQIGNHLLDRFLLQALQYLRFDLFQ